MKSLRLIRNAAAAATRHDSAPKLVVQFAGACGIFRFTPRRKGAKVAKQGIKTSSDRSAISPAGK
jgi:hypothetical protein